LARPQCQLNGGGTIEGGLEVMTYPINAYKHIHGVFAINDPSAQGAVMAARQAAEILSSHPSTEHRWRRRP
jgi:ABC-type sugar transport system substrate-binding protein